MPWRIHLANRPLHRIDLLSSPRSRLLAAWSQPDRVSYYELESGAKLRDQKLTTDWQSLRSSEDWQAASEEWVAPNGVYPPVMMCDGGTIYTNRSGKIRLYHGADGSLVMAHGSQEKMLSVDEIHALAMARESGAVAVLDVESTLHLCDRDAEPDTINLDLVLGPNRRTGLAMTAEGDTVFVSHSDCLLRVNTRTRSTACLNLHYRIGQFASSPDGRLLACADTDTNVIRLYDGETLTPRYQGHAVDLMAKAPQLQLIADLPPALVAVSNLALDDRGTLAFALAGVICVTGIDLLQPVPRVHQFA